MLLSTNIYDKLSCYVFTIDYVFYNSVHFVDVYRQIDGVYRP